MPQIFPQAIDEAVGSAGDGLIERSGLSAAVSSGAIHEKFRFDLKLQQPAFQRAIVKNMGFMSA